MAFHIRHPSWNSGEIARAIGGNVTQHYVLKVLKRRGFKIINPRRRHLPAWERQAVIDAYAHGEKVEAIAAEFGVQAQCIRRAARKAGLPPRATFSWMVAA